jgi:hypothetical protein
VAGAGYGRQQADLARQANMNQWTAQTGQQRAGLPTSYLGRGIYNSGIFQRGLRDFYTQRLADQQGIQNTYAGAVGQANLGELNAANQMQSTLAQIQGEEQARRADLAAQIRGVM